MKYDSKTTDDTFRPYGHRRERMTICDEYAAWYHEDAVCEVNSFRRRDTHARRRAGDILAFEPRRA